MPDGFVETGKNIDTNVKKCKNCGSNLVFDPSTQDLYCASCGTHHAFAVSKNVPEIPIEGVFHEESWSKVVSAYVCDNCGAQTVLDRTETATVCPFCGSAQVVALSEFEGLKPGGVVPFCKTSEQISEDFVKWAKKKLFAKRSFIKSLKTQKYKGIYMPCFTFDSNTQTAYKARLGKRKSEKIQTANGVKQKSWIEWETVSGDFPMRFDDVQVTAGSKLTQKELNKIGNFSAESNCEYKDDYLYGFTAYVKERDALSCWSDAKEMMDKKIKSSILSKYHYDKIDYFNADTKYKKSTYKYLMYPVYLGNYKKGKKTYSYMANGVTGKAYGKVPLSPWKIVLGVLAGVALVGLFFTLAILSKM